MRVLSYPGRELNPYFRCGKLDFKSSASTSSATQVTVLTTNDQDKNLKKCIPENYSNDSQLLAANHQHNLYRMHKKNPNTRFGLWSGRPGSNRPPRPWQGRALPNELLPLIKELRGAKIRIDLLCYKKI